MNSFIKTLAFCALLGASGGASAAPVFIPNDTDGQFTNGQGTWVVDASSATFTYPTEGGNVGAGTDPAPNGYGVMDANGGQWGIWINNGNSPVSLSSLGLVAGQTYTFTWDMKIEAGTNQSNIGGIKIESWTTGPLDNPANFYPTKIGTGATWETYSHTYTIRPGASGIKIVPLWGPLSKVGFDNFRVDNTPIPPPPVIPGIPNPGFEIPGGAGWKAEFGGGVTNFSYPTSGGNPGGYGIMTNTSGWGVFVSNGGNILTIGQGGQLPLTAGTTATFAVDMKILSGANIGKFKVDFFLPGNSANPDASTGDLIPALSGAGTEWATYTFSAPIPVGMAAVKLVPVAGANSSVGFDNIRIVDTFSASIANGFNVNWTADPDYSYQPQSSTSASGPWVNIGSPISGGAGSSIYQAVKAPFYQVLEITPTIYDNSVFNPGFETAAANTTGADGWELAQGVPPGNTVGVASSYGSIFPNSGSAMLAFDAVVATSSSEVRSLQFAIEPATTYNFSFYLSIPVKTGGAGLQYSLFYFDEFGALIDPTGNKFTNINTAAIGSTWTKVTQSITTPADAATVTVGFLLPLGADPGIHWVTLFDDVSIDTGVVVTASTSTPIAATTAPAVEVSWPTARVPNNTPGRTYQVKSSTNLVDWDDFGGPVTGNGAAFSVTDALTPPKKFFRVSEVTP